MKVLTGAGFSIAPVGPAGPSGASIAFPVSGGEIDPSNAAGVINHRGGLAITKGSTTVRLTDFVVNTVDGELFARVGNSRLQAIDIDTSNAGVIRRGPGNIDTWVVRAQAKLSRDGARALNSAFGVTLFTPGLTLGRVDVRPSSAAVILTGGATTLTFAPGAAAALTSLGITPDTVAPATAPNGVPSFPITDGKLTVRFVGEVKHSGGLRFTKGTVVVPLTQFIIDTQAPPTLTGNVGATSAQVPLLQLDLSNASTGFSGRQAVATNVKASLTPQAAGALNAAFSTTAFTAGLELGTARVQGRVK